MISHDVSRCLAVMETCLNFPITRCVRVRMALQNVAAGMVCFWIFVLLLRIFVNWIRRKACSARLDAAFNVGCEESI